MIQDDRYDRINRERAFIYRIVDAAVSADNLADYFETIYSVLREALNIHNFYIALYDAKTDMINFPCYFDEMEPIPPPYKRGRGLTEYVLRTGKAQLVTPNDFERLIAIGEVELVGVDGVDWIGVPLMFGNKPMGVLSVQTYGESQRLGDNELRFLDFVSIEISKVIAQKKADEILDEEELKYKAFFEATKDAVFLEALDGEILDCNNSACSIYGYDRDELLKLKVFDLMPDEVALKMPDIIDQAIQKGDLFVEAIGRRKDGSLFPTEVSLKLVSLSGRPVAIVFVRNVSEQKQRAQEVSAIASLAKGLRTAISFQDVLDVVLNQVVTFLSANGASFILRDDVTDEGIKVAAIGQGEDTIGRRIPPGDGISGRVITSGKMYITNELQMDPLMYYRDNIENLTALASVPLLVEDKVIGALQVARDHSFQDGDVQVLMAISDMAASAIHRAYLYQKGEHQAHDLMEAYEATLMGWSEAMELRDRETRGHSNRVVEKSVTLARILKISEEDIVQLRRGSLLHDIGKMGIPDSILLKPGPLSEDEWRIMKKHPVMAFQMLAGVPYLKQALDVPLYHHERWDGKGYPYGLKEKQIPILARIFAVIDVWDALTTDRPYRPGWSHDETLEYISQQAGKHFDPEVVGAFLEMMKEQGREGDLDD